MRIEKLTRNFIAAQKQWLVSQAASARLSAAIPVLKKRAKTIAELGGLCHFLVDERPLSLSDSAKAQLSPDIKARLARLLPRLAPASVWDAASLNALLKTFATDEGVGMGQIGPGLRAALTGGAPAPDLGQTLELLGREEALARLKDQSGLQDQTGLKDQTG